MTGGGCGQAAYQCSKQAATDETVAAGPPRRRSQFMTPDNKGKPTEKSNKRLNEVGGTSRGAARVPASSRH